MSTDFYDRLAPYYHLLYGDWAGAASRQGQALAGLLAAAGLPAGAAVLDAACGIGTQTLGLLEQGYQVSASDISPGALARLRRELASCGLLAEAGFESAQRRDDVLFQPVLLARRP